MYIQLSQIHLDIQPVSAIIIIIVLLSRRVRVLLDSPVFATFSSDGTTKLWDVQKLEGRNLINKAKLSYTQLGPASSSSSSLLIGEQS